MYSLVANAIPAQYPISLYASPDCQLLIAKAEVPNTECHDLPSTHTVESRKAGITTIASSVRTVLGSIPEGWKWHAFEAEGCLNASFVGIIPLGVCTAQTNEGLEIRRVGSVKVLPPPE
jgi:hypothetical protein